MLESVYNPSAGLFIMPAEERNFVGYNGMQRSPSSSLPRAPFKGADYYHPASPSSVLPPSSPAGTMSTLSNNSPVAGSPVTPLMQQDRDLVYSQSLANSLNEMMNLALLQNQLQQQLNVSNTSSPQQMFPASPFAFTQAANGGSINRCPSTSMSDVSAATLASYSSLSSANSGPAQLVSSSLYVKNLPAEADKLLLYEKFAPYGAILSVKVLNDESGKCKGVGFINYAEHGSAVKAIQALHATKMQDKVLHVSLQAPRARPGM